MTNEAPQDLDQFEAALRAALGAEAGGLPIYVARPDPQAEADLALRGDAGTDEQWRQFVVRELDWDLKLTTFPDAGGFVLRCEVLGQAGDPRLDAALLVLLRKDAAAAKDHSARRKNAHHVRLDAGGAFELRHLPLGSYAVWLDLLDLRVAVGDIGIPLN